MDLDIEKQLTISKKVMSDLLGVDRVEIERRYALKDDDGDNWVDGISFENGWYVIYPGKCTHKTIAETEEFDGFLVDQSVPVPGSFLEPDDVDVRLECESPTFIGALNFVMHQMMGQRISNYFEDVWYNFYGGIDGNDF